MLFFSFEAIFLVTSFFISSFIKKRYDKKLFPIEGSTFFFPFHNQKDAHKKTKKNKNEKKYELGIILGKKEEIKDIEFLEEWDIFEQGLITLFIFFILKLGLSALSYIGIDKLFSNSSVNNESLYCFLFGFQIIYSIILCQKLRPQPSFHQKLSSETKSSIFVTFIFGVVLAFVIFGIQDFIWPQFWIRLLETNSRIQILLGSDSSNLSTSSHSWLEFLPKMIYGLLLTFVIVSIYYATPSVLKFGRYTSIVNQWIRSSQDTLDRLDADSNEKETAKENLSRYKSEAKYILFDYILIVFIIILCLTALKSKNSEIFLLILILLLIIETFFLIFLSYKEIQTKNEYVFNLFMSYTKNNGLKISEFFVFKCHNFYKSSMREAMTIFIKAFLIMGVIFIFGIFQIKELTGGKYQVSMSQVCRIEMSPKVIFNQFYFVPIRPEDMLVELFNGYAVYKNPNFLDNLSSNNFRDDFGNIFGKSLPTINQFFIIFFFYYYIFRFLVGIIYGLYIDRTEGAED